MTRQASGQRRGGFSLVEMMIVVTVVAILGALALPSFMDSSKTANESAAISALRTICSAQEIHRSRYGNYATMTDLLSRNLIDGTFAMTDRRGYVFSGGAAANTWSVTADPEAPGQSGDRHFFVNESGVVRFSSGGTAGPGDPAIE